MAAENKVATYPVATIAKLLMITERRVQQLTSEGIIPKEGHGQYNLAKAVQGYIRYIQQGTKHSVFSEDDGSEINVDLERARKLQAERIGQEIKNAASLGELAPIGMLTSTLGDVVSHMNTHLESIPAVIKREWPEVPGHILDGIERGIAKLRDTIADARIEFTDPALGGGWPDGPGAGLAGDADGEGGYSADGE